MYGMNKIQETSARLYPKPPSKDIEYGTAGFRTKASDLPHVIFRMGQLSALRSKLKNGNYVGVMITASHNPEEDNGVKLVDPAGDMLEPLWEVIATEFANTLDKNVSAVLQSIVDTYHIKLSNPANLVLGFDTRESSIPLADAFLQGAALFEAKVKNFGLLTTPQLHYLVRCINSTGQYGDPSEEGYYKKLGTAFVNLCKQHPAGGKYVPKIKLDGANGVGALKAKFLNEHLANQLEIDFYNEGDGKLNYLCGADYVKIQQETPNGVPLTANTRCLSLDGDGDRIVYFYIDENNIFHLLDGDKISTLVTHFLQDLVKKSEVSLELCVVQTAYANGSSTKYICNTLDVPVACVPTGVKHLHHRAQEADIGVYFEANGHGTVLFKDCTITKLKEVADCHRNPEASKAALTILSVVDVINQTTGDAISDMLLVETILRFRQWSICDWDALYQDLPNRQMKVKVNDRNAVTTTDAERKCVTPAHLQEEINSFVKDKPNWRAFVRPSGTEDIVRVYAEADTQEEADKLAYHVSLKVFQLAGGAEPQPAMP